MSTQGEIDNQFSTNNNASFGSYVALIGSFIAVFYLYSKAVSNGVCCLNGNISEIFFVTALVFIVLAFLSCLSVQLGYSRRRDHLVSCASNPNAPYPQICGNGMDKKWHNYLLGVYKVFYPSFLISIVLFYAYSIFLFSKPCAGCWRTIVIVMGAISIAISVSYYFVEYFHFLEKCREVGRYNNSKEKD